MTALTKNPDPETASRPFDADRDGFVLSEGGVRADPGDRGARAGARRADLLRGRRRTARPTTRYHITAPDPKGSGATLAMRWALADAGAEPDDGRLHQRARDLDAAERRGRDRRDQGRRSATTRTRVAVSSTKSMTGHMLGAAGAVEGAACALAIAERPDPADDPLRDARPRLRPRRHAERGARRSTSRSRCRTRSGSAGRTRASRSARSTASSPVLSPRTSGTTSPR